LYQADWGIFITGEAIGIASNGWMMWICDE